jgi:cobalt-zinc-cadmium efflux system outer membrane protein
MSIRQARRPFLQAALAGAFLLGTSAQAAPLTLADALAGARNNLEVTIATRGLAAAQADILAADHAPLPQLSAKLSQIDLQNGVGPGNWLRDKRIDKGAGLDWTWERGDKRSLRTEAARRGAAAAQADVDDVRLQQMLAAHVAFFDLLAAQERLAVVQDIEQGTRQLAATAARRLQAGDLAQQDAARAAIEAQRANADTLAARHDLDRARGALALLLGLPVGAADGAAPEALQAQAEWPAAPATVTAPSAEVLAQRADVRAAAERVRAAESALQGSSAQRQSDITWGASFDHYPGTSTRLLEFRLSMPLTFGYRYEGEIGRSQAQLDQARDTLDRIRRQAATELQRLQAELQAATQRAQRYDAEIVPRSREVAQRAELAYSKGALPLTDLLDARRTLRAVLLDALAARSDRAKAQAAWQLRSATPALLVRPARPAIPNAPR